LTSLRAGEQQGDPLDEGIAAQASPQDKADG
jgi:hypothetical protein